MEAERPSSMSISRGGHEHALPRDRLGLGLDLPGLDCEQRLEFGLPRSLERFGENQQDPSRPFGQDLSHDETGFDRLSQADLVGKGAPALRDPTRREHYSVDLVGVDPPPPR